MFRRLAVLAALLLPAAAGASQHPCNDWWTDLGPNAEPVDWFDCSGNLDLDGGSLIVIGYDGGDAVQVTASGITLDSQIIEEVTPDAGVGFYFVSDGGPAGLGNVPVGWQVGLDCDLTAQTLIDGGLTLTFGTIPDAGILGYEPDAGGQTYTVCGDLAAYTGWFWAGQPMSMTNGVGLKCTPDAGGSQTDPAQFPALRFFLLPLYPSASETTKWRVSSYMIASVNPSVGNPVMSTDMGPDLFSTTNPTFTAQQVEPNPPNEGGNPTQTLFNMRSHSNVCNNGTAASIPDGGMFNVVEVTYPNGLSSLYSYTSLGFMAGSSWPADSTMQPWSSCTVAAGNMSTSPPMTSWAAGVGCSRTSGSSITGIVFGRIRIEYQP